MGVSTGVVADLTDEGLKILSQFSWLRSLSIDNRAITEDGVKYLAEGLKKLRHLDLFGARLSDEALTYIRSNFRHSRSISCLALHCMLGLSAENSLSLSLKTPFYNSGWPVISLNFTYVKVPFTQKDYITPPPWQSQRSVKKGTLTISYVYYTCQL